MQQFTFVVEPYGDGWGFGIERRKVLYHHSEKDQVIHVAVGFVRTHKGLLKIKDATGRCILATDYRAAKADGQERSA